MPFPDPKEVAEVVRQLNALADKGNWALAKAQEMGVRFDPQAPLDLREVVKQLPPLFGMFFK